MPERMTGELPEMNKDDKDDNDGISIASLAV